MLSNWMFICIAFFTSFILTSFLFSKLVTFESFRLRNFSAAASVILGCVLSSAVVIPFCWTGYDFVSGIAVSEFLAPVIGLAVIFVTCMINRLYVIEAGVLVASVIGVFAGNLFIDIIPEAPDFVNKLCSVAIWFLFSVGIRVIAALYPFLQIQGIVISSGIVLLYFFGAVPFMIGVVATTLLAAMSVAYLNYMNQTIGVAVSPIIGYLTGWFGLIFYEEMLTPCFIILVMVCLIEMFVSLIKKLTFMKKYKNYIDNSFLMKIYETSLPAAFMIKSFWIIGAVVVIFCVFQANATNNYSIPVFVAIVVFWQFYKLLNWKEESTSLKEAKKEVVDQIKGLVDGIKENTSKKKKTSKSKKGQKQ